ncbi:hypothetical protein LTR37_017457 [Vermiconidia calcicola]|uniref:Uncharacterized protein n=1 Tax=Vermiconidia calcicola TaxID=1690605 RepID=A0ACC3MLG4_9PEZI|nr:hypothetical protein LTR37_017457 [Vermiconidia calcicola]
MVNTAADARSIVSFAKFPPVGVRGQGSSFACFELGLATPSEYVAKANESLLTMIQIESVEALENIDEICQVEGIDLVFVGPNDLTLALLGYTPANWSEPVFSEAIEKIVTTAKKNGKKTGILATDGEHAKRLKKDFDLVAISTDVRALQAWYGQQLELAKM